MEEEQRRKLMPGQCQHIPFQSPHSLFKGWLGSERVHSIPYALLWVLLGKKTQYLFYITSVTHKSSSFWGRELFCHLDCVCGRFEGAPHVHFATESWYC